MSDLAEQLKAFGLYLENFEDWLGEPALYRYIVLDARANHVAYTNTLSGVHQVLQREKKTTIPTTETTQLALF